jgi:hypothetical protein
MIYDSRGRSSSTGKRFGGANLAAPWSGEVMLAALRRDYGPWPNPWIEPASLRQWASAAALEPAGREDWTAKMLPSYRTVAPDNAPELRQPPGAGNVLCWLHSDLPDAGFPAAVRL